MVTVDFHQKLVRNLEMFLLEQLSYKLTGIGYELILLIPTDASSYNGKSMLVISAKPLDDKREKTVVLNLLNNFGNVLNYDEFSLISSLKIINSNAPLVKNLNFAFPFYEKEDLEFDINTTIGGITLENARLIRSSVLPNLIVNKNRIIKLNTGETLIGKILGMSENFSVSVQPEKQDEQLAIANTFNFSTIVSVQPYK